VTVRAEEVARLKAAITSEVPPDVEVYVAGLELRFQEYVALMHDTGAELVREAAVLEEFGHGEIAAGLKRLGGKMQESG
jgi:hypothetical protein